MMFAFDEVRLHLLGTIVCTVALANADSLGLNAMRGRGDVFGPSHHLRS